MRPLPTDPVIDEVREVRHRISARFGHDPERLLEHYMKLQEEISSRLLQDRKSPETAGRVDD